MVTLRSASSRPYDGAIAAARTLLLARVVAPKRSRTSSASRSARSPSRAGTTRSTSTRTSSSGWSGSAGSSSGRSCTPTPSTTPSSPASASCPARPGVRARSAGAAGAGAGGLPGAVLAAWEDYRTLSALLREDTHAILADLRHLTPNASEKRRNKVARESEKKAIELARYVIPVCATTSMVHTLSGIVLHRLCRMMRTGDTPAENGAGLRDGRPRQGDRPRLLRARGRRAAAGRGRRRAPLAGGRRPGRRAGRAPGRDAGGADVPARRLHRPRGDDHRRRGARGAQGRRAQRRRGARGAARPRATGIAWRRCSSACTRRCRARCTTRPTRSASSPTPRTARTSAIAWCPPRAR